MYTENMTLTDIIFRSGGFKEGADVAYVEVSRRLSHEESATIGDNISHIYQFAVSRDLKLAEQDTDFKLQPFDVIYIRRAPGYRDQGTVSISGEIQYVGQYSISSKQEKVSDLLKRAGGLTNEAWPKGAVLTRMVILTDEEIEMKEKLQQMDTTFIVGEIKKTDEVIIGIELEKIINNPGNMDDILLLPGDKLHIPKMMQTVMVSGNVMSPVALTFEEGKTLRHYINRSGGFATRSRKLKTYVRYPNGITAATRSFFFFRKYPKIEPGSEIVVPSKAERARMSPGTWIAIGSGMATMAVSIATLVNLTK
jgi:protein involved in polysaccharide export with SLBB domain